MPTALVTGILGQDGTYLAALLEEHGFMVHGLVAPGDQVGAAREHLHGVDLRDTAAVTALIDRVRPDHVYNLAGISSVAQSWAEPVLTAQVNAVGALGLLEAAWQVQHRTGTPVRFVQASSGEVFGEASECPQTEATPLRPVNPYGVSKAFAHQAVGAYRLRGLHAVSAILYNHESPLRGRGFVTRKITSTVAAIARGEASELVLGNLDARRDWGWAPDYVRALYLAASHEVADDYIIATGQARSVRDFVAAAFAHVGIADWTPLVRVDPAFFRPVDAHELRGDPSHARRTLGWEPTMSFEQIVAAMVEADL